MAKLIATAGFGLEALVRDELAELGFSDAACLDNRVEFSADDFWAAAARANIWLRCAERVLLVMGRFRAVTYDSLFEQTKALPWDEWVSKDGKFSVTGKSVKSGLFSVPDVQRIVKKAVVEKLKTRYRTEWFKETGAEHTIQVSLLKDVATLTLDTTGQGEGLHKRGYRARSVDAPLKETMAAALLRLARYSGRQVFLDPCCGSGTLPIEAALMARNIAPGLSRKFACEKWAGASASAWKDARMDAYAKIRQDAAPELFGRDISEDAVELARRNAELAGVDDCIDFSARPLAGTALPSERGIAVVNPPYGERLGDAKLAWALYGQLGKVFGGSRWNVYVLTPDEFFEKAYKKNARAKRKLFNGLIKTDYYQYFG